MVGNTDVSVGTVGVEIVISAVTNFVRSAAACTFTVTVAGAGTVAGAV